MSKLTKEKPTEAEKYQKIALSHPIEAITVTEQERRKRLSMASITSDSEKKSAEFKTRTRSMVKEEW